MLVSRTKVLFLSDLDGTWLSKNPAHRAALDKGVQDLRDQYSPRGVDLKFGYVTARPPERVAQEKLPSPDWTITFNGGRIDEGSGTVAKPQGGWNKAASFQAWDNLNGAGGFNASKAIAECKELLADGQHGTLKLHTIGEVVGNPAADDCNFATHLCFNFSDISLTEAEKKDANANNIPDILEPQTFEPPSQLVQLAKELSQNLKADGVDHAISPVYLYHGKPYAMFDVATPLANKGQAVDFLSRREGVSKENLIIAGDGGNDVSMMRDPQGKDDGRRAIIVGSDSKLRQAGGGLANCIVQPADLDCSLGVLDGLRRHLHAIAG